MFLDLHISFTCINNLRLVFFFFCISTEILGCLKRGGYEIDKFMAFVYWFWL